MEAFRERFQVIYALPLLAITLLRHEQALRQQYGDAAFDRALATCNADAFYGRYLAPAVAQITAASAAAVRLLRQQEQEAVEREEAAKSLPELLDQSKLKDTSSRRNKPAEERERMAVQLSRRGPAYNALHDGIHDGSRDIDGLTAIKAQIDEEINGLLDTVEQRMLEVVPNLAATVLKIKPSQFDDLGQYLCRLDQVLQPAPDVKTTWHSHTFPLSSRLKAELWDAMQLPQLVQSTLADAFRRPLQVLLRQVMEQQLVEHVVQASCTAPTGSEQEQQAQALLKKMVPGTVAFMQVEQAVAKHVDIHLGGNGLKT
jgi:hypothetical protein